MKKTLRSLIFLFLILFVFCLYVQNVWAGDYKNDPDLKTNKVNWGCLDRKYISYIPSNLPKDKPVPLVICLHGFTMTADDMLEYTRGNLNKYAKRDGAIVLYPEAMHTHWNEIAGGTYEKTQGVDDIGYISFLIDKFIKEHNADPKRVYVTGMSNGGEMTYSLACVIPEKLKAVAPIVSNMGVEMIEKYPAGKPMPILITNGTGDPIVPWNGGKVMDGDNVLGNLVSADESVEYWVKRNGADQNQATETLPDKDPNDGCTVVRKSHKNEKNGAEVILYEIVNGGHSIPGGNDQKSRKNNLQNMDIDTMEIIWNFFMRH